MCSHIKCYPFIPQPATSLTLTPMFTYYALSFAIQYVQNEEFRQAAKSGDVTAVMRSIETHVDINSRNEVCDEDHVNVKCTQEVYR